MELPWHWLGRIEHAVAVAEMEERRRRILDGDASAQALLLCEHHPVITLGRSARPEHVLLDEAALAARGVSLHRASRGGDVTYHGPGQLMIYPVVRLRRGLVACLELIAEVLAEIAAELGAPGAEFRRAPAGLWLGGKKLAACGIHLRRGVVVHGWAFDVATPAEAWSMIVPCGLGGMPVVSVAAASGRSPSDVAEVAERVGPRLTARLVESGNVSVPPGTIEASPCSQTRPVAVSSSSITPTTTRS